MGRGVLVVIGAGGMGRAIARRQGIGKAVLLADFSEDILASAAAALKDEGHEVFTASVDVSAAESVAELARTAAGLGDVTQVAHSAGLSPVQATAAAILKVDLLGTALVLEEFGQVIAAGGAGVVISSMAGHMGASLTPEQEGALALTPAAGLLDLPCASPDRVTDPGMAYVLAKRANQVRVAATSLAWGKRGARINSISPGVVAALRSGALTPA